MQTVKATRRKSHGVLAEVRSVEAGSVCGETLKLPLIKLVELTVISRRAARERGVVSRRRLDLDA